jgi:hypothetical protein
MWKKLVIGILTGVLLTVFSIDFVSAQATVLPDIKGVNNCDERIARFNSEVAANEGDANTEVSGDIPQLLGCAIQTGRVSLAMIPYFLQYFSNYLLGIVSLIALLFVVIGGFMYTTGGVSEQKDTGKTFITNALIGMAVAFLAWTIVNVVLAVVTR